MGKGKIEEKLSYNDIIDRVFYTGNDNWHLKKFYDLRKEYNGKDVKNVKLIATNISDEGYCDILFAVEATKDGTKKKELVGANGEMRDNPTNEYEVTIRINDFWDLIEEFGLETKGDFTKADVVVLTAITNIVFNEEIADSILAMKGAENEVEEKKALSEMPQGFPAKTRRFWA